MKRGKIKTVFLVFLLFLSSAAAQSPTYTPKHEIPKGTELVAVYIGANDCVPCNEPEMKNSFRKMKDMLAARASKQGAAFTVTGVSLDWKVETGIKFLSDIGPFDEIIVGKNWINHGALEYIWKDPASQPAMPQVVIIERSVSEVKGRITASGNRVLARYFGSKEITNWVTKGALFDFK